MRNLIDLWPSNARWQEAFKIVVDKAMEAPLSSWLGLKLGRLINFSLREILSNERSIKFMIQDMTVISNHTSQNGKLPFPHH